MTDNRSINPHNNAEDSPAWVAPQSRRSPLPQEAERFVARNLKDVVKIVKKMLGDRIGHIEETAMGFIMHPTNGEQEITLTDAFGTFIVDGLPDDDLRKLQRRLQDPY